MKTLFSFLLLYILNSAVLNAQSFEWLHPVLNSDMNQKYYVFESAVDANDNIYSVGTIEMTGLDDNKLLLSKKAASGSGITSWVKEYDVDSNDEMLNDKFFSVAVVDDEHIHLAGESNEKAALWIANSSDGEITHKANISGTGSSRIVKVRRSKTSVGSSGNFTYVIGYFTGQLVLGQNNSPNSGLEKTFVNQSLGPDIFIAKYSRKGALIKAVHISGEETQVAFDLEVAKNGDIYASIATMSDLIMDNSTIYAKNSNKKYTYALMKFNSQVISQYAKTVGYAGSMQYGFDFSGGSGSNYGTNDYETIFMLALNSTQDRVFYAVNYYDSNGNANYDQTLGSVLVENGNSGPKVDLTGSTGFSIADMVISSCDSIYICANYLNFQQNVDFRTGIKNYLLTYASDNLTQTSDISSSELETSASIRGVNLTLDNNDNVLLSGHYRGDYYYDNFDPNTQGDLIDNYDASHSGFLGLYLPCEGSKVREAIISGPHIICTEKSSWEWSFEYPNGISNFDFSLVSLDPNVGQPSDVITYSFPTSQNPVLTITNMNGYQFPFQINFSYKSNCCQIVYDSIIVVSSSELSPSIVFQGVTDMGGNIEVQSKAQVLALSNIVYGWSLHEGEIDLSDLTSPKIVVKNEGSPQEVVVASEFDVLPASGSPEFIVGGLIPGEPYVIKLGMFFQYPEEEGCGWYETRSGFLVTNSNAASINLVPSEFNSKKKDVGKLKN